MGVGKIFSGGHQKIFPKSFLDGAKSGEICFIPLETKKKTFFAEIIKSRGEGPPAPPSDAHAGVSRLMFIASA